MLQPLPRAHRRIADPTCLPHIAQVMLTGEAADIAPPSQAVSQAHCLQGLLALAHMASLSFVQPAGSALPEPA